MKITRKTWLGSLASLAMVAAATVFFIRVYGFIYPGGDMTNILPQVDERLGYASFAGDLDFSVPSMQYAPVITLLAWGQTWAPLWGLTVGLMALSQAMLLYAGWRMLRSLSGAQASIWAVLFVATIMSLELFGNRICGDIYHSQATAFPLVALALAFVLEGRWVAATAPIAAAAFFHPLVGLYGVMLVGGSLVFSRPPRKDAIAALVLLAVSVLVFVAPTVTAKADTGGPGDGETFARILVFIRAPEHHMPLSWHWIDWLRIGLIAAFLLIVACRLPRPVRLWFVFLMAAALAGAASNSWFLIPSAVMANPMKMGAFILFLMWITVAWYLWTLLEEKRYYTLAFVVSAQEMTTLLMFCVVSAVLRELMRRPAFQPRPVSFSREALQDGIGLVGCLLVLYLVGPKVEPMLFLKRHLIFFAAASGLVWFLTRHFAVLRLDYLVVPLLLLKMGGWHIFCSPFPMRYEPSINEFPDKAWAEVCEHVRTESPPDACFVIPPGKEDFQLLAKRPCFVDSKHFPFSADRGVEWARRLIRLHVLDIKPEDLPSLDHSVPSDFGRYAALTTSDFRDLRRDYPFLDGCIVPAELTLALPLKWENKGYRLYDLSGAFRRDDP